MPNDPDNVLDLPLKFRALAEEFRALSEAAQAEHVRETFKVMASSYDQLAKDAEQVSIMHLSYRPRTR